MPYKEVQHKNPKEKTSLLKLSTQLEDYTKAHNKAIHPYIQHKDNLFHSNASSFMKPLTIRSYKKGFLTLGDETPKARTWA